jgi:hypothetical protein
MVSLSRSLWERYIEQRMMLAHRQRLIFRDERNRMSLRQLTMMAITPIDRESTSEITCGWGLPRDRQRMVTTMTYYKIHAVPDGSVTKKTKKRRIQSQNGSTVAKSGYTHDRPQGSECNRLVSSTDTFVPSTAICQPTSRRNELCVNRDPPYGDRPRQGDH